MMKALTIFDISGRAMSAQQVRLNAVASNLANAQTVAGTPEEAYKSMRPIFKANFPSQQMGQGVATVDTDGIYRTTLPPEKKYSPQHPKVSYASMDFDDAKLFKPRIIFPDTETNRLI